MAVKAFKWMTSNEQWQNMLSRFPLVLMMTWKWSFKASSRIVWVTFCLSLSLISQTVRVKDLDFV